MKIDLKDIHIHSDTNFGETHNGTIAFELNEDYGNDDENALSLSFKNENGEDVTAVLPKQELKVFSVILQNFVNEIK